jgi:Fe-S-cluster containining protein
VLLILDAFQRLPQAEQDEVRRRAQVLAALIRRREPQWKAGTGIEALGEERFDRLTEALGDEPCPFLDDAGACRIYADRPLICRIMGLGIRTPTGRIIENACPIQDQFPGYATLPPQPLDLDPLEARETACLEAASMQLLGTPLKAGFETTIALAISDWAK